mmetsp:Transcript_35522/g.85714  ORF Transcript_35522/g.85714 Transcript_35522/m.85714 type:complete len:89 (-) Transcript_35522:497-763(-)
MIVISSFFSNIKNINFYYANKASLTTLHTQIMQLCTATNIVRPVTFQFYFLPGTTSFFLPAHLASIFVQLLAGLQYLSKVYLAQIQCP